MRKLLLSLCLSALLLPGLAAAQNGAAAAQEPIPDGESNPARILLENAVLDAVTLIEKGDFAAAAVILDSLERTCPPDAAVQYYLGLCSYSQGDVPGTVARFEKAVGLDSTNLWYKETLANLYIGTGDAAKAGEIFADLSVVNPARFRNAYTLALMADAYRMKRDYDSFFSTLTDLVRSEDADDEMKYQALMGALGGFDTRTFNSILPRIDTLMLRFTEAEPQSVRAHTLRMQTASSMNDYAAVIGECERLIALQPKDTSEVVTYLAIIGDVQHETGEIKKAYKTYEQVLKLDPQYCPVLNNYAYFLSQQGKRLRKAEKMSRITVELEPDNATYLDTYGWILFLRGKAKQARPYFKHAMLYGGKDSAVVLMHFSLVLKALGEDDLATYYKTLAESKRK
ncbi:MAG: tetratricopeptide repeat protein [Bacteroidales bacterium]|nr:tetratricopeptide repeat protein [Bacteroidales bacterium]